jgi:hypothetical protein
MINYSWNCNTVDAYPEMNGVLNVIHRVHFNVKATSDEPTEDEPYSAEYIGAQFLNTEGITNFIPFESLTNTQLTSWIKEAMGTTAVANIERRLEEKVNSLISPTSIQLNFGG